MWSDRHEKLREVRERRDLIRNARKAVTHREIRKAYKSLTNYKSKSPLVEKVKKELQEKEDANRNRIPLRQALFKERLTADNSRERLTSKGANHGTEEDD